MELLLCYNFLILKKEAEPKTRALGSAGTGGLKIFLINYLKSGVVFIS